MTWKDAEAPIFAIPKWPIMAPVSTPRLKRIFDRVTVSLTTSSVNELLEP